MAQLDDLLKLYKPFDNHEQGSITQLQFFLANTDNAYDRSNLLAHVVADAWILNPQRTHVVLVEHGLNGSWIAPGGHCDGNPDVRQGSIREAEEECGLTNLRPLLNGAILDVATGLVPARDKPWGHEPAHLHFDICFAFEAEDNASLKISNESTALKWVSLQEIRNLNYWPTHWRRVDKTLAGLLDR